VWLVQGKKVRPLSPSIMRIAKGQGDKTMIWPLGFSAGEDLQGKPPLFPPPWITAMTREAQGDYGNGGPCEVPSGRRPGLLWCMTWWCMHRRESAQWGGSFPVGRWRGRVILFWQRVLYDLVTYYRRESAQCGGSFSSKCSIFDLVGGEAVSSLPTPSSNVLRLSTVPDRVVAIIRFDEPATEPVVSLFSSNPPRMKSFSIHTRGIGIGVRVEGGTSVFPYAQPPRPGWTEAWCQTTSEEMTS
jgi:hypothetical protein